MIQEVAAHSRQVQAIRFSPNNRTIVSCGSDFKVKVIDIVYGTVVFSKCEHNLGWEFFLKRRRRHGTQPISVLMHVSTSIAIRGFVSP